MSPKKWTESAYRSRPSPTHECKENGLDGRGDPCPHCAHPTGRYTTDGTGAGVGVAEVICCVCGERVDAQYSQRDAAPTGHGKHHPQQVTFTKYELPDGWVAPRAPSPS